VVANQGNNNHQPGSSSDKDSSNKLPPKVVYGYIRVIVGDEVRAAILKADLLVFCRSNGFMLSTVFTDFGVDDTAIARPGFSSLLDVCQLVGSYGVVVPSRMHLSAFAPTLEVLTLQIKRTGAKLVALDEVAAVGPPKGGSDAHA
jgi:resolvase-like protein